MLPILHAQAPPFEQRVRSVIEAYAHPANNGPLGYANIAAKLWLHEDAALCSRRLEELLAATDGELETVDGVGEIRAKDIREGLRRQQEINLVDRYLQT